MRLAICTFAFPEFSASLARALAGHCRPTLFVPEERREDASGAPAVANFPYSFSDGALGKLTACRQLVSQVRSLRPDVLHLQGWSPLLTPFLPSLMRFPIVFTWHDPVAHSGEEDMAMYLTQRLLVKMSNRVIVLTKAMRDKAVSACPWAESKIRVVMHGVFDYAEVGDEERPCSLAPEDKFVLFFGRVSPYKGVEDLCRAFSVARRDGHKLVIAGKHNYELRIPEQIRKDIIFINEYISNVQMRYLFRHAALVALPYRDATQSGVMMLAYAFGKPVLATRTGGMAEMIREGVTGIIVEPGKPEALAEALGWAIERPDVLREMGARGAAFAKANFGWDRIANDSMSVYEEAVKIVSP